MTTKAPAMKLVQLDPKNVEVPAIRVTNAMDEETTEAMIASVMAVGVREPIKVRKVGNVYILVDGWHRLAAARAAGLATVPAVVEEGGADDVALENLITSVIRGKPRLGDVVTVIVGLAEYHHLDIEKISEMTGLTPRYVTDTLAISQGGPELMMAVDQDLLNKSQAILLARVQDPGLRNRLLHAQITYSWTADQLRKNIGEVTAAAAAVVEKVSRPAPAAAPTEVCYYCGSSGGEKPVMVVRVCATCDKLTVVSREREAAASQV